MIKAVILGVFVALLANVSADEAKEAPTAEQIAKVNKKSRELKVRVKNFALQKANLEDITKSLKEAVPKLDFEIDGSYKRGIRVTGSYSTVVLYDLLEKIAEQTQTTYQIEDKTVTFKSK